MDEYVQDYIDQLLNTTEVGVEEFIEVVREYVRDPDEVNALVECKRSMLAIREQQKNSVVIPAVKAVELQKSTPVTQTFVDVHDPCLKDPDIKQQILSKYDLMEVKAPSNNFILPSYLTTSMAPKKKNKGNHIRYHNGLVVTTKGEKYI